jgi:hypothetical protein
MVERFMVITYHIYSATEDSARQEVGPFLVIDLQFASKKAV